MIQWIACTKFLTMFNYKEVHDQARLNLLRDKIQSNVHTLKLEEELNRIVRKQPTLSLQPLNPFEYTALDWN